MRQIYYSTSQSERAKAHLICKIYTKKLLLTEREVCTAKYRTEVFFVQTEPVGRGFYIPSKRG
jgi:hypothetical protein